MVLQRQPVIPSSSNKSPHSDGHVARLLTTGLRPQANGGAIQQLIRDVFADVQDIESFYNITFSRTRVSLLSSPPDATSLIARS